MKSHDLKYLASKVDHKHIAQIKIAQKQLGLGDEDYRSILQRTAGVKSSRDLTIGSFGLVMDEFRRLGFESTAAAEKRKQPEREAGHVTYAQMLKMQRLWDIWKGKSDPAGLRRWIQKKWSVSNLKFLDADTAKKALKALQNFKPSQPL